MRKIIRTLSRAQLAAIRDPEIRENGKFIVIDLPAQGDMPKPKPYWLGRCEGYTDSIEMAHPYAYSVALEMGLGGRVSYALVEEVTDPPETISERRKLRDALIVLGQSLYSMLQIAPTNPSIRAHIMARMRIMPPAELDTFEKIIEWIECEPISGGAGHPSARNVAAFHIDAEASEDERGTCRFRRVLRGSASVPITAAFIEECLEDEDADFSEILDLVVSRIDEQCREIECDQMDEDADYSDFEALDYDGRESDFDRSNVERQLARYLRAQLNEDRLHELGL